jgi:hypothetical protein
MRGIEASLAGLRPSNPKILVRDLDAEFPKMRSGLGFAKNFRKNYLDSCGYVRVYLPGYSQDGQSAVVIWRGGPSPHGLTWAYMLVRSEPNGG